MRKFLVIAVSLVSAIAASAARADEGPRADATRAEAPNAEALNGEALSVKVAYDDLDLQKQAGVRTLYSRIARAASRVCKPYAAPERDLARRREHAPCMKAAIDGAVERVGAPQLSRYAAEITQRGRRTVATARR